MTGMVATTRARTPWIAHTHAVAVTTVLLLIAIAAALRAATPDAPDTSAAPAGPAAGLLTKADQNKVWWTPQGTNVMIYQADRGGEPVMIIDKTALQHGSVTFDIRSDAKEYIVQSGSVSMKVVSGERDTLALDATDKTPGITLNGRRQEQYQRFWEAAVQDPTRTAVALHFSGASRAAVTVKDAAGAPVPIEGEKPAPVVPAPETPPSGQFAIKPTTITPKTETDAMLLEAQRAVFRLRVQTSNRGVNALGTGFLVGDDGFAVTTFQVVKGAEKGWALLDEFAKPIPVELWDVRPDLNLALIRLRTETLPAGTILKHLPIVGKDPTRGNETWTLNFSSYGQPTVSAGAVYDVLPYTKLPPEARSALAYNNLSHWVLTTAPVTIDNSGGPMVNNKGELCGVTTWVWPQEMQHTQSRSGLSRTSSRDGRSSVVQTYYTLHAQHIVHMLESKPAQPLTFAGALAQYGMARTPHNALPRVEVELFGTAQQLQAAANNFNAVSICPLCKGETEIVDVAATRAKKAEQEAKQREEQQKQQQQQGAAAQFLRAAQPTKQTDAEDPTVYKTCPKCDGSGFQRAESVFKLGTNMVLALAGLNRADPRVQPMIAHLQMALFQVVERNPQRLVRSLNNQTMQYLHQTSLQVGTPVLLIGMVDQNAQTPGDPNQLTLVEVGDIGSSVLVAEPDLASPRLDQIVLVGGILAGYLDDDNGVPIPIIHRGFIFNVPKEKDDANTQPGQPGQGGADNKAGGNDAQARQDAWKRWMESRGSSGGDHGHGHGPPGGFGGFRR
ncbi:MAG: hypothetical protein GC159_21450 [Phycisphaera sp.]|nr:hypothetical protein [Phycisphaera sp.]